MSLEVVNRRGEQINSVESWGELASPGEKRWRDEFSAKALAEAWIDSRGPNALLALMAPEFHDVRLERAVAEAQTSFDAFGGPRNHDLLIEARDDDGTIVIGLEGKVNETFGQTLADYQRAARAKMDRDEPTNAPARLEGLVRTIVGSDLDARPELLDLRYQLFSSTAGTLAAAAEHKAKRAILCVHELETPQIQEDLRTSNRQDLAAFARQVFGLTLPPDDTWLVGPVQTANSTDVVPSSIDLWIGHFVTA